MACPFSSGMRSRARDGVSPDTSNTGPAPTFQFAGAAADESAGTGGRRDSRFSAPGRPVASAAGDDQ